MKIIRSWCKKHANEILVGVICTIITTIFFNICDSIKEIGPNAGTSLFRFFSNCFFTTLSKTTETSILPLLFSILIGIAVACVIDIVVKGLTLSRIILEDGKDIIPLSNDNKGINVSDGKKTINEEPKTEPKDIIKHGKKIRILTILCATVFVFYLVGIVSFAILPNVIWREYQRDITKISPYIEQQELDIIKSDWVCMQNKDDFNDIYKRIDKVKQKYKLP